MEKLLKKVKQAKGNVLSIGFSFSGDVVKTLQKNKKVKDVHILSNKGEKPDKKKLFSFFISTAQFCTYLYTVSAHSAG